MRLKPLSNNLHYFISESIDKQYKNIKINKSSINFMNEIYDYILEGYENIPFLKVEKISENIKYYGCVLVSMPFSTNENIQNMSVDTNETCLHSASLHHVVINSIYIVQ
jgi:hypothetical protein